MENNHQKYNQKFLWLICLVAAMGGFLFGYDWVVVGGAKPFYEPYFGLTSPGMKGWGTSSALIGCIFGALLCFSLSDKYGRRRLLILSGALFTVSAIGTAMSNDFTWYNIYRIVGGFGIGIALNLSPMYIAEMSPPHMRGKLVSINQLMIMFGILAAQVVNWQISLIDTEMPVNATEEIIRQSWNGQMGWRWMFGAVSIPALLFFLFMFFMPESVRWLVKNGQNRKAINVLSRVGGAEYAGKEVAAIKKTISEEEVSKVHFGELLKPGLFKILLLGIFLAILQQWCGMNVIFYYAADIFQAAGYNIKQLMLQIVVIGTIMVLSVFVTIFVVDRVGRKFLMLLGTGTLAVIYIIEGYLFHLAIQGMPIVILTLCSVAFYSLTLAPVVWIILSEIFPNRIRGAAMSLAAVALWIGNFSLTFSFPSIKENLGWTFNFWLYAIICIIGFMVIIYKLPETKGKSLEEIEDTMADRKSGKMFVPNKKHKIMKEKVITVLLLLSLSSCVIGQVSQEEKVPLAPKPNRNPEKVQPFSYKHSLEELKNNFSEEMMRLAAKQNKKVKETNIKGKWKPTVESIDSHTAPEWFKDLKFGMWIDWGPWAVAGWAPKKEKGAMYPDWYEFRFDTDTAFFKYHEKNWGDKFERDDFISLFTAKKYQPQKLVDIAKGAGMKYVVPFTKHHGGFCLWPYILYST